MAKFRTLSVTKFWMLTFGIGFLIGMPVLFFSFPEGFQWGNHTSSPHDPFSPYAFMIGIIYMSLGLVLIKAACTPKSSGALIDFIVVSSLLHGALMLFQSFIEPYEMMHLIGDVPLLFLIAAIFWYWHPKRITG